MISSFMAKPGRAVLIPCAAKKAGRQLGWYVGIAERGNKAYAFALNFSDNKPVRGYAGPRAKRMAMRYFAQERPLGGPVNPSKN